MTQEALKLLLETGQQAKAVELVGLDPRGDHAHYRVGGELKRIDLHPSPREHTVCSLEDLCAFAEDHSGNQAVWHHSVAVTLVLDDDERRDRVVFPLSFSEPFEALRHLDAPCVDWMDQRAFIRLLDLTLGVDNALIAPFRRLDWKTQIEAMGEITHDRDRLGKEVNATVSGTAALPTDLVAIVPVYREADERQVYDIRCRIETYPQQERLALKPIPGEIDDTIHRAQASIHQRLVAHLGTDAKIYYGAVR